MKKRLLILSILVSTVCFSQSSLLHSSLSVKDGKVYYDTIIQLDGTSKDKLFEKSKIWALNNFKSQKDALQAEDREIGLLTYKTFFTENFNAPPFRGHSVTAEWKYIFTVKLYLKEGKAKIVIDNVYLSISVPGMNMISEKPIEEMDQPNDPTKYKKIDKEYFEKSRIEMKRLFDKANLEFNATMQSWRVAMKAKSESDF